MNDTLKKFLKDVYLKSNQMILSSIEIEAIEKIYKENYKDVKTFDEMMSINPTLMRKVKSVKGAYAEISRQISLGKTLQPGTICECVLAQTIANMYQLTKFVDSFHSFIRELPANILPYLRSEENTLLCRYIYYDPENVNNFLIQYGNPTSYDADLFLDNKLIKLEFKDQLARAGEVQFQFDENGKLLYDKNFELNCSEYLPLIEKFNEETDIISIMGSNYKDFPEETKREVLKKYFTTLGIDSLVSYDDNNQLIAITLDCVDTANEFEIISTKGSEIKTAGKNPASVFTPKFLLKSIKEKNGIIQDSIVTMPKRNMENRIGRGKNGEITGKKINSLFFVFINNIEEINDNYRFSMNDIKELQPTFSIHVQIIASKEELKRYYSNILE